MTKGEDDAHCTEETIEVLTAPDIAYLAVSDFFQDKREWMFLAASIGEHNDGGKIIIERLEARGILVEACPAIGTEFYHRADQLRQALHRLPDVPRVGRRRDQIRELAAALPRPFP